MFGAYIRGGLCPSGGLWPGGLRLGAFVQGSFGPGAYVRGLKSGAFSVRASVLRVYNRGFIS